MKTPCNLTALVPSVALACLALTPASAAQQIEVRGPDGGSRFLVPEGTPFRAIEREAPASVPSRQPGGISAPAGYQDAVENFGGAVDIHDDRIIFAEEDDARIFSTERGTESDGLIANNSFVNGSLINAIYDVSVEGDWAVVVYGANLGAQADGIGALFNWNGTDWVLSAEQHFFFTAETETELHDGSTFAAGGEDFLPGLEFGQLFRFAPQSGASTSGPFVLGALPVKLSVGDDPMGSLCGVTFEDVATGARTVRAYRYDKVANAFTDLGVVATGTAADGFGDGLAVADGLVWIGIPFDDSGAIDAGKFQLYFDDGAGGWAFGGEAMSTQAGDEFGRELAVDGDVLITSERHADLLYLEAGGGLGVGAVRLLRHDGNGLWTLTGEITHSFFTEYSTPDDYGASIAVDGLRMTVGEPDGGAVTWWPLSETSLFTQDLAPALPGFLGEPFGAPLGLTIGGVPAALEIAGSVPFGQAFLVLGLSALGAPFKSGVLLPNPDVVTPLPLDATGGLLLPFTWSTSGSSAFTIFGQYWIPDAGGPAGFSATQGFSLRQDIY